MSDTAGLLLGFVLTLFVFSYLVADNPLFRLATHILVGVSAAYAAVVVIEQVLLPIYDQIAQNPASRTSLLWLVPIGLGLLLMLQRLPGFRWLGTNAVAFLVGIGAAVALVGAISGTLWPQVMGFQTPATANGRLTTLLIAILTVLTLLSFQFTQPTPAAWQRHLRAAGQAVLTITFGALFASMLNTSLLLLAERLSYYFIQFRQMAS